MNAFFVHYFSWFYVNQLDLVTFLSIITIIHEQYLNK